MTKKLSGEGGFDYGGLVINRIRKLSNAEWDRVKNHLSEISFWDLPTEPPATPNPDGSVNVGFDGAQWILEGFRDGKYHVTDRWSAKAKYREACLYFLELSNLRVKESDIY